MGLRRWASEALQQRQQMAEDAANAGRAIDTCRAEELALRQQLVELRAQASRAQAEVSQGKFFLCDYRSLA